MIRIITIAIIAVVVFGQVDPPTWPNQFTQVFIESYQTTHIRVSGTMFYDAVNNMSRVDRVNGEHQQICGSIQPNISTACSQLVRDGKRYVVFPEKRSCCMCCDASHGCGILRPDWLKEAKYQGNETLSGENFYKWSIPDGGVLDYYWATKTDQRIPRKMDEGGSRIKDYIMNTYNEDPIAASIFALPSYCNSTCSPTTVCGKFQSTPLHIQ